MKKIEDSRGIITIQTSRQWGKDVLHVAYFPARSHGSDSMFWACDLDEVVEPKPSRRAADFVRYTGKGNFHGVEFSRVYGVLKRTGEVTNPSIWRWPK